MRLAVLCFSALPALSVGYDAFACSVKAGALEQSTKLLNNRHSDRIRDALNFSGSGCAMPTIKASFPGPNAQAVSDTDGVVLHVSASAGSDDNLGSASRPLRSLHEAQQRLRVLTQQQRAGACVILADGTHFLEESLVFTAADSGTKASPVRWQAGGAVVSGGKDLDCAGKWQVGDAGIYTCRVPQGLSFDSLFVAGQRQVRARYPNGSPYVPNDGYESGCKTLSVDGPGIAFEKNVQVIAEDGTHISSLSSFPQDISVTVTVKDTSKPRTVSNCKQDQVQYHGTRFNDTFNYPFWKTSAPTSITLPPSMRDRGWGSVSGSVVKMIHPAGWGGWGFEVANHDIVEHSLTFSKGGFQEARGNNGCGKMYVENLFEELDAPGEWWLDVSAGKLHFIPPKDWTESDLQKADVIVPQLQRLIQFRGSPEAPVHDIILEGFNVTHSAPTYLESYEAPSGGDWSIHRGAAVFLDGAERITLQRLVFDQVDGNGVFLSNHAVDNVVQDCDFWRTGDSAMAVVGSVPLGDARKGSGAMWPVGNTLARNWIEEVGVHMKQTSCVFRSLSEGTVIRNNVCYNGPRAGINFNDGFIGGDLVEGNVIFNMVRETGDHGTFNSWDRREIVFPCQTINNDGDVDDNRAACFTARTIKVQHNMFIGPAGWNMDHDDGSSQYEDFSNVVYLGNYKFRDGVMRNMTGNLMVQSGPVFQVTGFDTNYWVDNTIVDSTVNKICAPATTPALRGTIYALLAGSPAPSPSPTTPAPVLPGWSEAKYCTSCEHSPLLRDMGKEYGSTVDCMSACSYEVGCEFINYAENSDHHCALFAKCDVPWERPQSCADGSHNWWTTYHLTGARAAAEDLAVGKECWTEPCICDEGKQTTVSEDDLAQMIRDTVATGLPSSRAHLLLVV